MIQMHITNLPRIVCTMSINITKTTRSQMAINGIHAYGVTFCGANVSMFLSVAPISVSRMSAVSCYFEPVIEATLPLLGTALIMI